MGTLFQRRHVVAAALIALLAATAYTILGTGSADVSTSEEIDQPIEPAEPAEPEAEVLSATETDQDGRGQSLQVTDITGFTGDAEVDLPTIDPAVTVIEDLIAGIAQRDLQPPVPALQPLGDIGWDIKDLRVKYVATTDELIIGLNSYGIVGDPEGNNDPASFDQRWIDGGAPGTDSPDLGANEGATIALDLDNDGVYDIAVGTNYSNTIADFGVFEFTPFGLFAPLTPVAYGAEVGEIAVAPISPSAGSPDLVFSIANFSQLPGNETSLNFGINANLGSGADGNIGEDSIGDFSVAIPISLDAEIGDFVFSDTNADGIQDPGEPGIEGITVRLLDENGSVIAETTTNSDGQYIFTVPPGTYAVEFVPRPGDAFSPQNAGRDTELDSNANPSTGRTSPVFVGPGESNLTIDAGIVQFTAAPAISIEKSTNGEDADTATGPRLEVGSTATFLYLVTNTGNVPLVDVTVTDDQIGAVTCPASELDVAEFMECNASTTVTAGQYRNVGSVTGTPTGPGTDRLGPVNASDPSHHVGFTPFTAAPSVDLEKAVNGIDADDPAGPELVVGETATFTFVTVNTGNIDLIDIAVTDDILGDICTVDRLAPGERETCETTADVVEGQHRNVGSVTATGELPNGDPLTNPLTDEDPAHYTGTVPGPACVTNIRGPRLYHGSQVTDETGYVAAAGSTIYVVTTEPGDSPDQPHEQVYFQVGDDVYGPTPVGLGEFEFTVANTGPVTVLHYSVVTGDTSRANSVEYEWCGTDLTEQTLYACPTSITGPRMYRNSIVEWDSELIAAPGSTIEITTSEPGGSPGQPHEQVYVFVGDEQFGPTPNEHGTTVFTVGAGGRVVVKHYSELHDDTNNPNSVEFTMCGSSLTKAS